MSRDEVATGPDDVGPDDVGALPDDVLDALPSLGPLYARAVLPRRRPGDPAAVGRRAVLVPRVVLDRERVAAYARVCGFGLSETVPVTYPHVLAFPAQVHLMVTQPFPPLLGLVHVRQSVRSQAPLPVGSTVSVRAWAGEVLAHPRGLTVDLHAQVRAGGPDGDPVWSGTSRYLRRGPTPDGLDAPHDGDLPAPQGASTAIWPVGADTGRRYAAVSGDVNPIHLSALSARPFGFRRAIAHGMWTMARTLAVLGPRAPAPLDATVAFGSPVLLPSTLALTVDPVPGGGRGDLDLAVRSRSMQRLHLSGTVRETG